MESNRNVTISLVSSPVTRINLRGKLKKSGIYDLVDRMYDQSKRSRTESSILRLGLINLIENQPTAKQLEDWSKMLSDVKEFDKYLEG